jgi:hypothetical protein
VGKRHRRIRAHSATGQVAGAATEKPGLKAHRPKRPAQPAFSQKAPSPSRTNLSSPPDTTRPSREQFHATRSGSDPGTIAGRSRNRCERLLHANSPRRVQSIAAQPAADYISLRSARPARPRVHEARLASCPPIGPTLGECSRRGGTATGTATPLGRSHLGRHDGLKAPVVRAQAVMRAAVVRGVFA